MQWERQFRTALVAGVIGAAAMFVKAGASTGQRAILPLHSVRSADTDLEVAGLVAGVGPQAVGYIRRKELVSLPQTSAVVQDDPDVPGVVMHVRGVRLSALRRALGMGPEVDLIDAVCSDGYRSYYPQQMVAAHEPILVLTVDGMAPKEWAAKAKQYDPAPYLILYDRFKPAWRVLAHEDRPQLPTNVVRVEFGTETQAFGRIAPRGLARNDARVEHGYLIARQNCIRCHAEGTTGGTKSNRTWSALGQVAKDRPQRFARWVKDPGALDARATMPGNPEYDAATLGALTAYFSTFAEGRAR